MNKHFFIVLTLSLTVFTSVAKNKVLQHVPLTDITPEGWLKTMLINQRDNFSGLLDKQCFPFSQGGWGENPFIRKMNGTVAGFWVPYEQTGYYYDGVIRAGYLLKDTFLINKSTRAIEKTIKNASPEGILEPILNTGDRIRWPHAVFFRAWMAEYESTGNKKTLQAMERHFLNDTVALSGRDLCNLEAMVWLYQKTGNKRILQKAYEYFTPTKQSNFQEDYLGDFGSEEKQEVHGVTYNEMLKLPILNYILTGKKDELSKVRNGFKKLDKYHMLPDGVNSSEEGNSGKGAQNTHETCNIIDYLWTCSYMLRATGEIEWGDRMERALFNAGMGSITKNFDAHQYYSCPNQIFSTAYSSHVGTYEISRLAYRKWHKPPCCTGNLNRMFPVYIGNQWLTYDDGSLYKALYGPGSITHKVGNQTLKIEEESVYPYSDTIIIRVVSGEARFRLNLRIPHWSKTPKVLVNGVTQKGVSAGKYFSIHRTFKKGDVVSLYLPKQPEFINWDGYEAMVVNYGPLLFALPVDGDVKEEIITNKWLDMAQPSTYNGYDIRANSDWNYILGVDGKDNSIIRVVNSPVINKNNPWEQQPQPIQLRVPMYKDPTWTVRYQKVKSHTGEEIFEPITPPLPARGAMIFVLRRLKPESKTLVPYGSTLLRMSMFPFWKEGEIAPEILATE